MAPTQDSPRAKRSEPRERLLSTASTLFYAEGIGSVGVNRIVSESKVTLATLYRHFSGKEGLVVAYLQAAHDAIASSLGEITGSSDGVERVRALGVAVAADIDRPGFRGCAFLNAASEFQAADNPVRRVVAEHRRWYYEQLREAFAQAGHRLPGNAARHFVMLRDGAMTAGYLETAGAAQKTLTRGVEGLLRSVDIEPADLTEDDD